METSIIKKEEIETEKEAVSRQSQWSSNGTMIHLQIQCEFQGHLEAFPVHVAFVVPKILPTKQLFSLDYKAFLNFRVLYYHGTSLGGCKTSTKYRTVLKTSRNQGSVGKGQGLPSVGRVRTQPMSTDFYFNIQLLEYLDSIFSLENEDQSVLLSQIRAG